MTEIDLSQLRKLAADCRKAANGLEKDLYEGVLVGGEIVAAKARKNAAAFPRKGGGTTRIADSVKVRRRGVNVKIQAGGNSAPEAAPIENHGRGGSFRHPVPGDGWVSQPSHPFLTTAAEESAADVEAVVLAAVDETIARFVI